MKTEVLKKWHYAGLQAFCSASEQGKDQAEKAAKKFTGSKLQEIAKKVFATMDENEQTLANLLEKAGEKAHAFKDQIMEGINEGTSYMLKAAKSDDAADFALLSGGIVGLQYFVGAFKSQTEIAAILQLTEQAEIFKKMSENVEALFDEYDTERKVMLGEVTA